MYSFLQNLDISQTEYANPMSEWVLWNLTNLRKAAICLFAYKIIISFLRNVE